QRLTLCSLIVRGDALAKGQYRLEFKAPNYATVVIPEVKFPAGKFTVQLDIRMKRVGGCIRGVVVNRDGKPVSGAEVILRAIGKSQSATKQVQTQLTKKDGSFQFDALREGNYILQVMPDARIVTSSMQIVKVIAGETVSARMTVQMRKEQPIVKIQLLRADGCTPIARTRVRISLRMIYPERRYGASATLTTDAHGRCFMPLRKEPAVYRAYLTFAGWCILKLVDARANKMPEVKVIVPSEPQVICRIKAPDNTLIPGGVYIHLYAGDDLGWENIGSPQEGIMRIAGLLPGNYKLAVTPIATYSYSEYQHARIFPAVEVKISDEQTGTVDVTLSLPRCGTLRGKVLMVKNGHERPLQFANVQLERIDGDSGQLFFATASRNDGSFTFTTIPIGDYKLTVRHTACEETQMRVTVTDKPDNRNSQFVTIRLKYVGLGTIVGRVIDSAGTSVANATVIIRRWDERAERQYQVSSTRTDAQGAFQCAGLRPGRYIIEIITDDGNGTSVDKIIVRGDRTTDVGAVRLPQPSIILGKVTANDESIL
ncbi:MAG TPA: carboxypeptidase regulatory-like domain-containing protein, partial [Armatimonadetes bacterium]|nr:carboxypeptidase regulatory-like domain-containing protein [Armatimonadota bacterium]